MANKLIYILLLFSSCNADFSCNSKQIKRENIQINSKKNYFLFFFNQNNMSLINYPTGGAIDNDSQLNDFSTFKETSYNIILEQGQINNGIKSGIWSYYYIKNNNLHKFQTDWVRHTINSSFIMNLPKGVILDTSCRCFFKAINPISRDSIAIEINKYPISDHNSIEDFKKFIDKEYDYPYKTKYSVNYVFEQDSHISYFFSMDTVNMKERFTTFIYLFREANNYYKVKYTYIGPDFIENSIKFLEIIRNIQLNSHKILNYVAGSFVIKQG
jgi:hypothetical protein